MKEAIRMGLERYYSAIGQLVRDSGNVMRYGSVLKRLQRGLTGDRRLAGDGYFSDPEILGAYLLYYWPSSFLQAGLALEELSMRGALPELDSVLDLGSGPGPAACAAAERGARRLTLLDADAGALGAAGALLRKAAPNAQVRAIRSDLRVGGLPAGPFDLIVASHSVNELWKEASDAVDRRAALLRDALSLLSPGGILLVIEPSALATSRPALELRNKLLEEAGGLSSEATPKDSERFECVGPCPHSGPCPMARAGESRTCHSTWPWEPPALVQALAREAGLDRDSVKCTWFALSPGGSPPQSGAQVFWAADKAAERPRDRAEGIAGRIVSDSMLNKAGRIRYIVCAGTGLETISARASDPEGAVLSGLGRGDCVALSTLERRPAGGYGFIPVSELRMLMKAPRA